eukprot:m.134203 g.134203  ORF g.134203 m.134203 type:complete len:209 (+) comp9526_c0_seq1:172-798(+)
MTITTTLYLLLLAACKTSHKIFVLLGDSVCAAGTSVLDAGTAGHSLICELLLTSSFSLTLVDVLHQHTFVLEDITLRLHVEFVIQMAIDLLGLSVLLQKAAEDTLSSHPENLHWHTSVGGTLALTMTSVSTLTASLGMSQCTGTRMDNLWLLDDKTILNQLLNTLAAVGVGDLCDLIWVKPDFAFTDLEHAGSKALLKTKQDHLLLSI